MESVVFQSDHNNTWTPNVFFAQSKMLRNTKKYLFFLFVLMLSQNTWAQCTNQSLYKVRNIWGQSHGFECFLVCRKSLVWLYWTTSTSDVFDNHLILNNHHLMNIWVIFGRCMKESVWCKQTSLDRRMINCWYGFIIGALTRLYLSVQHRQSLKSHYDSWSTGSNKCSALFFMKI